MRRDFACLGAGPFEVLVVGGGIYGAWTAYDCALRGLRVALVERGDWGGGTSSASSKLIHGGLRYLEHGQVGLVRNSIRERAVLRRIAPHRITPLRFAVPTYAGASPGKGLVRLGLGLYDFLAGSQRVGVAPSCYAPPQAATCWPFLRRDGLSGVLTYGDAQTDDARLTLEIVAGAEEAGAALCSYAEATAWLRESGRICGAVVRDVETGRTVDLHAALLINTAGAAMGRLGGTPPQRLTKGVHLVMPKLPSADAVLLRAGVDGRVFFLIPWYGRTLLGTTDTDYAGDPDSVCVEAGDIDYLLDAVNGFFEGRAWRRDDVLGAYAGLRALKPVMRGDPSSVSREWTVARSTPGMLSSVGGKLTTARLDASRLVDRALRILGRPPFRCGSDLRKLPWALTEAELEIQAQAFHALGVDFETGQHLARRYGRSGSALQHALTQRPEFAARIVDDLPFCWGEVVHAARHEMAVHLVDILRRRIPLVILSSLSGSVITKAGVLAGETLGWNTATRNREIAAVQELCLS